MPKRQRNSERSELNDLGYKLLAQAVLYESAKAIARLRDGKKGPHNFHEPCNRKQALREELAFLRHGVQHQGIMPNLKDPLCFHEIAGVGDLLESLSDKDLLQRIVMRTRVFRQATPSRGKKVYANESQHEGKKEGRVPRARRHYD